jgi:hypothetical protein
MTTTRIATSTQKIVAIGVPPGFLLNLQLRLYNCVAKLHRFRYELQQNDRKRKAAVLSRACDRFTTMERHRSAKRSVAAQRLATLVVQESRPLTQHKALHKKLAVNPAFVWRQTAQASKHK